MGQAHEKKRDSRSPPWTDLFDRNLGVSVLQQWKESNKPKTRKPETSYAWALYSLNSQNGHCLSYLAWVWMTPHVSVSTIESWMSRMYRNCTWYSKHRLPWLVVWSVRVFDVKCPYKIIQNRYWQAGQGQNDVHIAKCSVKNLRMPLCLNNAPSTFWGSIDIVL